MTPEDFREVIKSLEQTPLALARVCNQLSPVELRFKDSEDFSALENICHLRDIEIEGYGERIVRILQEDEPLLADIDGGRLALERDYNNQVAESALAAFTTARKRNVKKLRQISPEHVARKGNLAGVGLISLGTLLEMMNEHDQEHLTELERLHRKVAKLETAK